MRQQHFGTLIKGTREQRGWTQHQLATAVGRSRGWLNTVETGKCIPDMKIADELIDELGLDPVQAKQALLHATYTPSNDEAFNDWESIAESLVTPKSVQEGPTLQRCSPRSRQALIDHAEQTAEWLFPFECEQGLAMPMGSLARPDMQRRIATLEGFPGATFTCEPANGAYEGMASARDKELKIAIRGDIWAKIQQGDGRSRFTLAHELGHVLLHGNLLLEQQGVVFRDMVCTATQQLPPGVRIYESPEWQANTWASAFLMPTKAVSAFLRAGGVNDFDALKLSEQFGVSYRAAQIRLEQLLTSLFERRPDSFEPQPKKGLM